MKRSISTAGLVAAIAIGCGSSVPPARVASAEAAVQTARASGANSVPEANKHLLMAEDALAKAKTLNADKDHDEAEAMFSRAEADAALAASLANEAKKKGALEGVPQQPEPARALAQRRARRYGGAAAPVRKRPLRSRSGLPCDEQRPVRADPVEEGADLRLRDS